MKSKYDEPFKTIKLNNNDPKLIVMNSDNTYGHNIMIFRDK